MVFLSAAAKPRQLELRTQFQIEDGGVVQGVTKLISTFSAFCDLKLKLGQLSLQKMGLILNFQEKNSFSKRDDKNPTCYKKAFFLIIFTTTTKKTVKFGRIFLIFF